MALRELGRGLVGGLERSVKPEVENKQKLKHLKNIAMFQQKMKREAEDAQFEDMLERLGSVEGLQPGMARLLSAGVSPGDVGMESLTPSEKALHEMKLKTGEAGIKASEQRTLSGKALEDWRRAQIERLGKTPIPTDSDTDREIQFMISALTKELKSAEGTLKKVGEDKDGKDVFEYFGAKPEHAKKLRKRIGQLYKLAGYDKPVYEEPIPEPTPETATPYKTGILDRLSPDWLKQSKNLKVSKILEQSGFDATEENIRKFLENNPTFK